jgi:hypothetical protein
LRDALCPGALVPFDVESFYAPDLSGFLY